MKFETYRDKHGKWRWRIVSRNGKIPGQEGYASRANAERAASSVSRQLASGKNE